MIFGNAGFHGRGRQQLGLKVYPVVVQDAKSGQIIGINSGFPDQVMSAASPPAHSSGRRRSGNNPDAATEKLTGNSAALRQAGHAARSGNGSLNGSEQPAADAAVRKSSRFSARRTQKLAEASQRRPDDSKAASQPSDDSAGGPQRTTQRADGGGGASAGDAGAGTAAPGRRSAAEPRSARNSAARRTSAQVAAAVLKCLSVDTDPDNAAQRDGDHARTEDVTKGAPAGAATSGPRQEASRPSTTAGRRPGKMRFLADIMGTLPSDADARSDRGRSASDLSVPRSEPVRLSGGAGPTRSADAATAEKGKGRQKEDGAPISGRAAAAAEPSSDSWTEAQVSLAGLRVAWCHAAMAF